MQNKYGALYGILGKMDCVALFSCFVRFSSKIFRTGFSKVKIALFSGFAHAADPVEVMDCEHKAKVELQWLAKVYRLPA